MGHAADLICAVATAHGGAIGIIRVSGEGAIGVVDGLFSRSLSECDTSRVIHGFIGEQGEPIDEVLVTIFRAPHSYTGEESVEISFHDSVFIAQSILKALTDSGCRLAQPGEFTMRAFLNGKMDLTQAEAVADLIASRSAAQHRVALGQLRGGVTTELAALRSALLEMTSLIELEIDFSEEDVTFADRQQLLTIAQSVHHRITTLMDTFDSGRAVRQGVPVAIVGAPNVGKSTLLNALVGDERAIVSDVPGTTRDAIEDVVYLRGVPFRFIDTAGLRETNNKVERIGIALTHRKMAEARVVVLVTTDSDAQLPLTSANIVHAVNKIDLHPNIKLAPSSIAISAKSGYGLEALKDAIYNAAALNALDTSSTIITSARHYEALATASADITAVIEGITTNISSDLLALDLHSCANHLATITGNAITPDATLATIFSHFCIGK